MMSTPKTLEVKKILEVRCPHCGMKFAYQQSQFRPFCSKRCRMVDLGHWLDGSYAVDGGPATAVPEESPIEAQFEDQDQEQNQEQDES